MKRMMALPVLLLFVLLVLLGCNKSKNPVATNDPLPNGSHKITSQAASVMLDGFEIEFTGRTFNSAKNRTTFSYMVSGTNATTTLLLFLVEIPDCDPHLKVVSYSPANAVRIEVERKTHIYGIQWRDPLAAGESRAYSFTLKGNVARGTVHTAVKVGHGYAIGNIAGPSCEEQGFDISGTVFTDADKDGTKDGSEAGISDVTVTLLQGSTVVTTTTSDGGGEYLFEDQPAGNYTVTVEASTVDNDFNETLSKSFQATTATSVSVTIGPDSEDNNFGYAPDTDEIINDFDAGEIVTDGETLRFWKMQVRSAVNDGAGDPVVDAATLQGYLDAIENLFLPDPFQFNDDHEFEDALLILTTISRASVDQLKKQLLAAELNDIYGRGLMGSSKPLQPVLLKWGETLVFEALNSGVTSVKGQPHITAVSEAELEAAKTIFTLLNSSGGGGDEE